MASPVFFLKAAGPVLGLDLGQERLAFLLGKALPQASSEFYFYRFPRTPESQATFQPRAQVKFSALTWKLFWQVQICAKNFLTNIPLESGQWQFAWAKDSPLMNMFCISCNYFTFFLSFLCFKFSKTLYYPLFPIPYHIHLRAPYHHFPLQLPITVSKKTP